MAGDVIDILVGGAEGNVFTPDKYPTQKATEVLAKIPSEPITTDLLPALMAELDGFKNSPNIVSSVAGHADHFFIGGADFGNTHCESVSYDPAGLIGIKFDNPKFGAIVVQPDDEGDGLCRIHAVTNGVRHEYKMVGGQLVHGFHNPLAEDSRTYQLLAHMGVDVALMDNM